MTPTTDAKTNEPTPQRVNPASASELDLATVEGVRAYLAKTPFESADITPLFGGTANYVFRLRLIAPHHGKLETLVFKHAKPYVKDYHDMAFALERQIYEVEALRRVREWLPADSVVTVPEVFFFDEAAHAIIMEDTGEGCVDLKTFLKKGAASLSMAKEIGAAIGTFLGGMHKWGQGNKELCAAVKGNKEAKQMTAWVYYGRLISTLTGKDDVPKLRDPVLDIDPKDLEVIGRLAEEGTRACLEEEDSFVMGDFWPGNLMVQLDAQGELKRIYVLDWELAKAGLAGMEVGQFVAEIHLLRRCIPDVCTDTASLVLEHFLKEYKRSCEPDVEVARRTVVRWGVHMAILGGRVEWGGKELTREVVLEGMRLLVDGYEAGEEWLKRSCVGPMLSLEN
ncbi:kinase-like domain-containing protein [Flammula alnicola]|nr:kinase-like domain-containing protein [Flammula alnicola]